MVTKNNANASRGDVWLVDLTEPPRGHETGGKKRPALVMSVDKFNHGPAGLVIVIPISTVPKGIPTHVEINPPEGGVNHRSFIKCEEPKSVSVDRLEKRFGQVKSNTIEKVEENLKILLDLF
jgi:mRNA interferase MazF